MTNQALDNATPPPDAKSSGERRSVMAMGVVVERRPVANPWAQDQYVPIGVIPNAGPADWVPLVEEGGDQGAAMRWHVATLDVPLYRSDSEAYLENLNADRPAVYVVLRPSEDPDDAHDVSLVAVTLSPYEAQDFLDSGDDIVEPVAIPDAVLAWMKDFIARHYKETPFKKRKRKSHIEEAPQFGKVLHPVERAFYERRDEVEAAAKASDGDEGGSTGDKG
jgi:hypothetical protein